MHMIYLLLVSNIPRNTLQLNIALTAGYIFDSVREYYYVKHYN